MVVLAADTSTPFNSVALCDGPDLLAESTVRAGRKHSERLLSTVEWLLSEAGLKLKQVDLLAIAHGPGSFTGLRVGVATWKGLSLGADIPLMGVSTLDAMSRLAPVRDGLVCPLLDAKMGEVYGAVYSFRDGVRTNVTPESVGPVEEILASVRGPVTAIGDGVGAYEERVKTCLGPDAFYPPGCIAPRAWTVASEALERLGEGIEAQGAKVRPVYLRRSQAEEARSKELEKAPAG